MLWMQVTFSRYTGRYPVRRDVCLKELSFSIKSGEKIGIVGRTGAGKSSVALVLFRYRVKLSIRACFLPHVACRLMDRVSGSVAIDNEDIDKMDLARHRSRLTIIPQDPAIFNGSLRFNLDPEFKYSDYHLWDVLRATDLTDFVKQFPEGLDFQLDSDGTALSEGERQLVCCIRGLLSINQHYTYFFHLSCCNCRGFQSGHPG